MADQPTATVVGGGIAGLAAATSLAQSEWQTTVLERAPAFGEVGAGLALTRNGIAALDALGVGDPVRAAGCPSLAAGVQDPHGRWLLRVPDAPAEVRETTTLWGIHRQRLHAALRQGAEAAGVELVTGAEVTAVRPGEPGGDRAAVDWRAGTGEHTAGSDLVVAADGLWSAVRAQLFPAAHPRYSGATCWRAVITGTVPGGRFAEVWGPGTEFGVLPVSAVEIYWYGYFQHPEGASFDDEAAAARRHFAHYAPGIQAVVEATPASQLMRHDVYHLPGGLPAYSRGRVVLVGDAAHAMLPTVGQGAATAVEDGVCVGRLIAAPVFSGRDLAAALESFDRARRPRCRQLARQAVLMARVGADLADGWRQPVRNALLRLVPAGSAAGAGARVVRWTPPAGAAAVRDGKSHEEDLG